MEIAEERLALARDLERQHAQLAAIEERLAQSAELLTAATRGGEWQGPAQAAWHVALAQLRDELRNAIHAVASARRHTATAVRTMDDRG